MKLWKNATFYSMNENNDIYHSIITKDNIILAVNPDIKDYDINEIVDLSNTYVYPGFKDSHLHLIGYGRKLNRLNLNLCKDKDEVIKILNSNINNNEILLVEGYYNIGLTKHDLDSISKDKVIILRHNDYHSFTINSYTLNILKINNSNGIIIDDETTSSVLPIWQNESKETLVKYTKDAIDKLHSYGITEVHSDCLSYFNSYEETIDILNEVTKFKPLRIKSLIHYDIYSNYLKSFQRSKYVDDIQIKMFYDGTISSKTALLKDNYKNTNNNGKRNEDTNSFVNKIKLIRNNNHAVAIHTIGDLALEEVMDILTKHPNTSNIKDRIVHASLANNDLIKKLSMTNIALDIQPLFIKSDENIVNTNISHDVLVYPFKEYNSNKIILNSSSDAPVEDPNPLLGLYHLDDLPRLDALKTYTVNPSKTISNNNGIIDIGKNVDLSIFTKDLTKITKEELLTTKVYKTVVDGVIVYKGE